MEETIFIFYKLLLLVNKNFIINLNFSLTIDLNNNKILKY